MPGKSPGPLSFSILRRWSMAFQVGVSALSLLAIVVMVNYLSARHHHRWQWSADAGPPLSPLTRQLLATLTNDVQITVLFDPDESRTWSDVEPLLEDYRLASPRIRVDAVNYVRHPGRAEFVRAKYQIPSTTETLLVVFDSAGRPPRVLREKELSDYDTSEVLSGQPPKRVAFRGEQMFTSALLAVTDSRPIRAFYVLGHGEPDPGAEDSPDGYHRFTQLLGEKNVDLVPYDPSQGPVPESCELLVIAGPRRALPVEELRRIEAYLQRGGRALILLLSPLRPGTASSGIERILQSWGIGVGNNLVIDKGQSQSGDTRVLLTREFGSHPVVRPLAGLRLGLVMPVEVGHHPAAGPAGDLVSVDELVFTSPEGMAVVDLKGTTGVVETNGVLPLAVAAEKGAVSGVGPDRATTRMVVVGEASFLSNQLLDVEANRDFASLAVNWLLDRRQLLAVGPRPVREYRVSLSRSQLQAVGSVLLGVLPGAVLLFGIVVWMGRRK